MNTIQGLSKKPKGSPLKGDLLYTREILDRFKIDSAQGSSEEPSIDGRLLKRRFFIYKRNFR